MLVIEFLWNVADHNTSDVTIKGLLQIALLGLIALITAVIYFVFLWLLIAGVINTPTGYVAAYVTKYVMWIILHGSVFVVLSVLRRERTPTATEGDPAPNHLIHGNTNND